MHEWFAQPIAASRTAAMRQRATTHRLRVVGGNDFGTRVSAPLLAAADRSATRLRQRQVTAAAAVGPACC